MKYFLLLVFLILTGCGYEVDPRTLYHNRKGLQSFSESSLSDSQNEFLKALSVDPFISELHVNLGRTFHDLKQPDNALQSYESAEKWGRNKRTLFAARFNQGVVRGENQQIEEALQAYQRSLDVQPDSKEAKTNIELLVQSQMDQGGGGGGDKKKSDDGGKGDQEKKDKDDQKGEEPQKEEKKQYEKSNQYKPREFKGELSESDVKKILGELKQQEQKIRGQFYRQEKTKEAPRDKDW